MAVDDVSPENNLYELFLFLQLLRAYPKNAHLQLLLYRRSFQTGSASPVPGLLSGMTSGL